MLGKPTLSRGINNTTNEALRGASRKIDLGFNEI
jgi:hypothetical protein